MYIAITLFTLAILRIIHVSILRNERRIEKLENESIRYALFVSGEGDFASNEMTLNNRILKVDEQTEELREIELIDNIARLRTFTIKGLAKNKMVG